MLYNIKNYPVKFTQQAMAQATGPGLAWLAPGFGPGLEFPTPESDEAKPAEHQPAKMGGGSWGPQTNLLPLTTFRVNTSAPLTTFALWAKIGIFTRVF